MSSDGAKQQGGKAPAHPPYLDMVHEAIKALKDRTGSSGYAIKKYITQHYGKVKGGPSLLLAPAARPRPPAGGPCCVCAWRRRRGRCATAPRLDAGGGPRSAGA